MHLQCFCTNALPPLCALRGDVFDYDSALRNRPSDERGKRDANQCDNRLSQSQWNLRSRLYESVSLPESLHALTLWDGVGGSCPTRGRTSPEALSPTPPWAVGFTESIHYGIHYRTPAASPSSPRHRSQREPQRRRQPIRRRLRPVRAPQNAHAALADCLVARALPKPYRGDHSSRIAFLLFEVRAGKEIVLANSYKRPE